MYEYEYNKLELEPEDSIVKYKQKFSMNEVFKLMFLLLMPIVFTAFLVSIDDLLPAKKNNKIALGGAIKKTK